MLFRSGSGAVVAATSLAGSANAQDAKPGITSGATDVTLNVNGKDHTLRLAPNVTLLHALRNDLNLTGCKDVENTSEAGADTVMIDGKATYAGTVFAIACQGKKIQTVESLNNGNIVDEVVLGFVKHDAMQCGFCTPGFVVATRAFLNQNPDATLDEIRKGLGGNLCRCGTYAGITQCALELAKKGGA